MAVIVKFLVLAALCVELSLQYTPFFKCNEGPAPELIEYEGCKEFPCKFKKNGIIFTNHIVINAEFITVTNSTELIIEGDLKEEDDYRNIMIKKDNCQHIENTKCPLSAGQLVKFNYKFSIPFYAPSKEGVIRVSVYNEKKELQTCFELLGMIV